MLSKSDWRLSQSVGSLIVANILVSSAKLVMLLLTLDEISLIRTRKSTGPNTVPCGTPLRTLSPLLTPPGRHTKLGQIQGGLQRAIQDSTKGGVAIIFTFYALKIRHEIRFWLKLRKILCCN